MKKQIGIVGGAGYTGGELLRLLINHPHINIAFVNSNSQAGKPVYSIHTDLLGSTDLVFSKDIQKVDALFLCAGHGESKKFLETNSIDNDTIIIDLSTDYRDESNGFVYGLCEFQKEKIKKAKKIANPGCFATSIELGLLPLAAAGLIKEDVHVSAVTGSTGAGQSLSATGHFSWRSNNISIYKPFSHQHLIEIGMVLSKNNTEIPVHFLPYRGSFTRGIMANIYTKCTANLEEVKKKYQDYYQDSPFVFLSENSLDLKQVVNTNKGFIHIEKHGDQILITSIIDNLLKGASGQAVQNLNLIMGWSEDTGLKLKGSSF
ncbi:MAG: N-acetyl-gamma-glutamyl-phosphate reductase [Bacteroidota bacterium]|jgi:N-acetyl-gamma-glutamyl-phosphate reductase